MADARSLVTAYLQEKGVPVNAENIRRAINENARSPGTVKGLVNGAPEDSSPAPSNGNARNQPPLKTQGGNGNVGSGVKPTTPRSISGSATTSENAGGPGKGVPAMQATGSGGLGWGDIAGAVLGGGGLASLLAILGRGRGSAGAGPSSSNIGSEQGLGISGRDSYYPPDDALHGEVMPRQALPGPTQQPGGALVPSQSRTMQPLPDGMPTSPQPPGMQAGVSGPSPMPQISDRNMVGEGVNPVGPPQPGRMQPGPSSEIPLPPMPQGAAAASDVASRAPVSIVPRPGGVDAHDLGGVIPEGQWAKILGTAAKAVGRR